MDFTDCSSLDATAGAWVGVVDVRVPQTFPQHSLTRLRIAFVSVVAQQHGCESNPTAHTIAPCPASAETPRRSEMAINLTIMRNNGTGSSEGMSTGEWRAGVGWCDSRSHPCKMATLPSLDCKRVHTLT